MKRALNKLTARAVESASFAGKNRKFADGGGLYLLVTSSGKYWRVKYRLSGKEKVLALGVFPEVSLAKARKKRDESRPLIEKGIDPVLHRRSKKQDCETSTQNTFKKLATEWYQEVHSHNVSKDHAYKNFHRLETYIFPKIGNIPISEITSAQLLSILRQLENKGILETVSRLRSLISQVFRYAISTQRADRDIALDLRGALKTPKVRHFASILDPKLIGKLLRAIDGYVGQPSTFSALRLLPYLFVRPGELRHMKWKDLDLANSIWHYKPSKNGLPFEFPLSSQAVQILEEQHSISGECEFVFPANSSRFRPIANNTLNGAIKRLDFQGAITPHGFRAMARTLLAEKLGFSAELIEQQLAHTVKDSLGRAYNRTTFFEQRKKMMQVWGNYLDSLRTPTSHLIAIHKLSA